MNPQSSGSDRLSKVGAPTALFGSIGGFLARSHAENLVSELTYLWQLSMGAPLGELTDDLELLRRWFDPVAQGSRLRRDLQVLAEPHEGWNDPGPPFTFVASGPRRLITPEGRCALDFLRQGLASSGASDIFVGDDQIRSAERTLLDTYLRWSRHRLESVVGLLDGASKPLQISAAGVVIALLVNRCTSPDRALTRFAGGPGREVIDEAFFAAVNSFAATLNTKTRGNPSNARLISGWMLYEAGRRLGNALVIEDARGGQDGAVWLAQGEIPHVLGVLARDLSRGRRGRVTTDLLATAFDSLVDALRHQLPNLAGFGLAHERPIATSSLRRDLLKAFDEATAESASEA